MNNFNFNNLFRNIVSNEADMARDRASWEGANAIERATFGKVFNAIEAGLFIVMFFGCIWITGAIDNGFFKYLCGFIWVIPFIAAGTLLYRARHAVFMRLRGTINSFLGGGPR